VCVLPARIKVSIVDGGAAVRPLAKYVVGVIAKHYLVELIDRVVILIFER
jgi:hypothetical protein